MHFDVELDGSVTFAGQAHAVHSKELLRPLERIDEANQLQIMQLMLDAGVATRRGVMCSHREAAYPKGTWSCGAIGCECRGDTCARLTQSERGQDGSIILPLFAQMTREEQDRVVIALRDALRSCITNQKVGVSDGHVRVREND